MTKSNDFLQQFLMTHELTCAVLVDPSSTSARIIGSCFDGDCADAVNRDFYDNRTTEAFKHYLQGKKFPQISARGTCWIVSGILPSGHVVSFYGESPGDIHTQIKLSKNIWNKFRDEFASSLS